MLDKPRILFYDLETKPLQAWLWSPGKQYVGHKQLVKEGGHDRYGIICVGYCWNDGKPAKTIDWGYEEQNTDKVVEEFDKILRTADHVIGKNNQRFDDKMLNAARMFAGLPGYPEWVRYTDDLERQMRRFFRLPSQSLDYISDQMGLGGKIKMEFQDWIDIVTKNKDGQKSLNKMTKYCRKDVTDTRTLWNKLSEHFLPTFNVASFMGLTNACKNCAGPNIRKDGHRTSGGIRYQHYFCTDCNKYAGRRAASQLMRKEGKLL